MRLAHLVLWQIQLRTRNAHISLDARHQLIDAAEAHLRPDMASANVQDPVKVTIEHSSGLIRHASEPYACEGIECPPQLATSSSTMQRMLERGGGLQIRSQT